MIQYKIEGGKLNEITDFTNDHKMTQMNHKITNEHTNHMCVHYPFSLLSPLNLIWAPDLGLCFINSSY